MPSDTPTAAPPPQASAWLEAPRPAFVRRDQAARPDPVKLAEGLSILDRAQHAHTIMRRAYENGDDEMFLRYAHAAAGLIKRAEAKHAEAMKGLYYRRPVPAL